MITNAKIPSMRFRSIRQIPQDTLRRIEGILTEFQSRIPFKVYRFLWGGSYVRDCSELHSDIDLNLDIGSGEERDKTNYARLNDQETIDKLDQAIHWFREATKPLGIWFSLTFTDSEKYPCIADNPDKRCYSVLERTWYHANDPTTLLDFRKKGFGYTDDDGVEHPGEDPYKAEADTLKGLPGFIDVETDKETAHYRRKK